MELTPVRIRGKHSRSSSKTSISSAKRRGRPLGSKSSSAAPSRCSTPSGTILEPGLGQRAAKNYRKPRFHLSPIERLPVELLQTIFFYSMNICLPRSSSTLASHLSSEHIFLQFSFRALYDHYFELHAHEGDECRIIGALKSQLLQCRFFTFPFFRQYITKAHAIYCDDVQRGIYNGGLGSVEAIGSEYNPSHLSDKDVRNWFQEKSPRHLDLGPNCYVPEKVLRKPWTEDKSLLLYSLISFGAEIDWEGLSGELAATGLLDAIKEGDERAVAAIGRNDRSHRLRISTQMIRAAVLESSYNKNILWRLVDWQDSRRICDPLRIADVDYLDPALWAWIERESSRGNPDAEWIRQLITAAGDCDGETIRSMRNDCVGLIPAHPYHVRTTGSEDRDG